MSQCDLQHKEPFRSRTCEFDKDDFSHLNLAIKKVHQNKKKMNVLYLWNNEIKIFQSIIFILNTMRHYGRFLMEKTS